MNMQHRHQHYMIITFVVSLLLTQAPAATAASLFPVTPGDVSIDYLGRIFGNVDYVLGGTGTQILGAMFKAFNIAALAFGSLVLAYSLLLSLVNSAHEGEILGRKFSTLFLPIRILIGLALLVPKASGYSLLQVFVMWTVMQGVYAADTIWGVALDYLAAGGEIYSAGADDDAVIDALPKVVRLFQLQVCNEAFQIELAATSDYAGIVLYPGKISASTAIYGGDRLNFPGNDASIFNAACGYMTLTNDNELAAMTMWLDIKGYARSYVTTNGKTPVGLSEPDLDLQAAMINGAKDYIGIMYESLHMDESDSDTKLKKAKELGWIIAGAYYYRLMDTAGSRRSIDSSNWPTITHAWSDNMLVSNYPVLSSSQLAAITNITNKAGTDDNSEYDIAYHAAAKLNAGIKENDKQSIFSLQGGSGKKCSKLWWFLKACNSLPFDLTKVMFAMLSYHLMRIRSILMKLTDPDKAIKMNPLYTIAKIGNYFLMAAIEVLLRMVILSLLLFAAGYWGAIQPLGYAVLAMSIVIAPLMMAMVAGFIVLGFICAYYIPFLPYIMFFFATIGWFAAVIESMIAAPLVALGITHPEGGHDIVGVAAPGLMLLTNVFLRPSLLIFGLIVSISLSYAAIYLLALGFNYASVRLQDHFGNSMTNIFAIIAYMSMYVLILQQLFTKSCQLIYDVPDRVLTWIGGYDQLGSNRGQEQGLQQAVQQTAQPIGGAGKMAKQGLQSSQGKFIDSTQKQDEPPPPPPDEGTGTNPGSS